MKKEIPDESTVRKYYIEKCYKETVTTIRQNIADNNVWISIDETADIKGRYIVNVVIGSMETGKKSSIHLLSSEQIQKTNSSIIAQVFSLNFS